MAEADGQVKNLDVAMFIDWENRHGCIRGKANKGYNRLKELMQEGERLGYFTIGKNDKEIDYVSLKELEL